MLNSPLAVADTSVEPSLEMNIALATNAELRKLILARYQDDGRIRSNLKSGGYAPLGQVIEKISITLRQEFAYGIFNVAARAALVEACKHYDANTTK